MFSRGGLSRLIFLEVICLPTALSIRSLFFTRTSSKMAGNEDACKYVILLFISVVSRLFQDRRRRRFQERLRLLAVQSGRKKNRGVVLSEDLRGFKVRSKKEIWLGFRAAAVLVRTHGSEQIWRQPLAWTFSSFKTNLSIGLWACRTSSCTSQRKHASSNSGSEASRCCYVAPCNRQFLSKEWTYIWCREMDSIKTWRWILFSPVKSR